jgi:Mn2+/Fe2+ NRAMP family transporter
MSNCHILLMAVVALRNEGHMTLANELEAIQQHQKVAIAKATQP